MPLKVIGTGFGRTGTDSMREALDFVAQPCGFFELQVGGGFANGVGARAAEASSDYFECHDAFQSSS